MATGAHAPHLRRTDERSPEVLLAELSRQARETRAEIAVLIEHEVLFNDSADESQTEAVVSDSVLAAKEAADSRRHAEAMARSRSNLEARLADIRRQQDALLEDLPTT